MRLLPKRLAPRLILALVLLVAAVATVSAWVNIHVQREQLMDQVVAATDQLSASITSATWHLMLLDERETAYQVMRTMGEVQGVESIRVFDKEGRITFSTADDEGGQVDKNAEACFLCHARQEPLVRVDTPSRVRVYRAPDGHRRMAMVTPILNEPSCSDGSCHAHPPDKRVLGVLDVAMDLEPVDSEVERVEWWMLGSTLVEIALVALLISLLTRQLVDRPIRALIRSTKSMRAMDLDNPVEVDADGELGELATHFDGMREQLRDALGQLEGLTHRLEHKVEERSRQLGEAQQMLIRSDRLASLGQLAASVAHEINNPIAGVLNLSMLLERLLQEDGIPPGRVDEFREYLRSITEEVTRVGNIVSDLLAFSRHSSPVRSETDLDQVVAHTVSLISHQLDLAGVELQQQLGEDLPRVWCDGSQIEQVLINLVMNAAEASERGQRILVRTRLERRNDAIVLEVSDHGHGIDEPHRQRIFDPFYSTKEEGHGVGLGLSVVHGIVESHGGTIEVRTTPGGGTTMVVRLPLDSHLEDR